jgi:uncharacterized protein
MKFTYLPFRYKKIKNKYLVTGDNFNWTFLNELEFNKLKNKKIIIKSSLGQKLIKNNIILQNKNQTEKLIERKRNQMGNLFFGPSLHIVVLTKRCNQSCIYCHATAVNKNRKKYDMDEKTAKNVVDTIMSSPSYYITIEFQGGEPLLNFQTLKYIYKYATEINKKRKKDLDFSVVTNLELMDDKKLDWLISKKIEICTSIDGPKKLHDKNRPSVKTKSSYDNIIKWLKRGKTKNKRFGALITVSRESLKYPKEIVDEYVKLEYGTLHLRELHFLGKAIGVWKNIGYTAEEFIEFWKKSLDYIIELNKKGTYIIERRCHIMLQKILKNYEPGFLDLMSPCGAIIGQIAYNIDGKIYTCDEARTFEEEIFQIGDAKKDCIPKIMTSQKSIEIISSTINDSYYCDYCAYKTFCGICPVCHYKETGSPISDVLRTSKCKIHMAIFDYIFEKLQDKKIKKIFEEWVNPEKFNKANTFQ